MSSMTPFQSPHFAEHKAELARQRRIDLENAELLRMRNEKKLQLRKGDLRRREQELNEREMALAEEKRAVAALRSEYDHSAAVGSARSLVTDVMDHAPVSGRTSALAEAIVAAGAARRNELGPPPLPSDPTAKAVILSGKRARNEPVAAADEQWLDAFCVRLDNARR